MKIDRGRGPVTTEDIGINAPTIQGMPPSWGSKKGHPLEAAEGARPGDAWILDFCPQAWEGTFLLSATRPVLSCGGPSKLTQLVPNTRSQDRDPPCAEGHVETAVTKPQAGTPSQSATSKSYGRGRDTRSLLASEGTSPAHTLFPDSCPRLWDSKFLRL